MTLEGREIDEERSEPESAAIVFTVDKSGVFASIAQPSSTSQAFCGAPSEGVERITCLELSAKLREWSSLGPAFRNNKVVWAFQLHGCLMGSVHKNEIEPGGKLAHSKFDQGNDTQSESTTNYGSENEASDSFLKKIVQATENQVTKSSDDSCVSPPSAGSRHFNPSYETSTDPEAPVQYRSNSFRPRLQTQPTTAVSLATTFGQHISDSAHDGDSFSGVRLRSGLSLEQTGNIHGGSGKTSRTGEDSSSVRSYIPSLKAPKDVESSLGGILSSERGLPTWESLNAQASGQTASLVEFEEGKDWKAQFEAELEEVLQGGEETVDEGILCSLRIIYHPALNKHC